MAIAIIGIISIVVAVITFIAMHYAAQVRDNAIHDTIGKIHENALAGCERLDTSSRADCITAADNAYTSGLLTMSAISGIVTFFGIILIIEKIFGGL